MPFHQGSSRMWTLLVDATRARLSSCFGGLAVGEKVMQGCHRDIPGSLVFTVELLAADELRTSRDALHKTPSLGSQS